MLCCLWPLNRLCGVEESEWVVCERYRQQENAFSQKSWHILGPDLMGSNIKKAVWQLESFQPVSYFLCYGSMVSFRFSSAFHAAHYRGPGQVQGSLVLAREWQHIYKSVVVLDRQNMKYWLHEWAFLAFWGRLGQCLWLSTRKVDRTIAALLSPSWEDNETD